MKVRKSISDFDTFNSFANFKQKLSLASTIKSLFKTYIKLKVRKSKKENLKF
ncbi:hypothetical protein [Campylobacter sp.]|uniref:hypothetical protein n=1 Tax=Campylobacter sp. TaxID=205 RepID=UPI002AA6F505|nr:hypothetical protein [Campylobacter sp.]MCI6661161.1 hypothetical protein [Campylobacter sp.]